MQPEIAELDPAQPGPLADQDAGDQKAAEREEHPDTEQPAWRPRELLVVGDDREHGERTQTIQARHVELTRIHRPRHVPPSPGGLSLPSRCRRARSSVGTGHGKDYPQGFND